MDTGEPVSLDWQGSPHRAVRLPTVNEQVASLYRAHALGLTRAALLLVGDRATAEDVVHDAFFGLYRGWRRLRDPDKAAAYLRAAVVNRCRSAMRSRRVGRERAGAMQPLHDATAWSAEAAVIAGEEQRAALAAVARLPRRQREILVLRYYLGLADSEIAVALRISRGTVSSTCSRALAALTRELKEKE
jgi:RNA polymerase sigma-70 factor (sigma-E family)